MTSLSVILFTMTELSQDKGLMDGSVDGLGDIMHMFELIEGEENKRPTSANFEPQDQFEYIEVTSHIDGGLKSQRGKGRKSSFSSDLHIIVLSDEEGNGQSAESMSSRNDESSADPNESESAFVTSIEDGGEIITHPEEEEIQIRNILEP